MMNNSKVKKPFSVKTKDSILKVLLHTVLVVLSVIWLFPILWMVLTAFRVEYNEAGVLIGSVQGSYFLKD